MSAVYCEISTKLLNTLPRQNTIFNIKLLVHIVTTVLLYTIFSQTVFVTS
jgi:hypothetical protein